MMSERERERGGLRSCAIDDEGERVGVIETETKGCGGGEKDDLTECMVTQRERLLKRRKEFNLIRCVLATVDSLDSDHVEHPQESCFVLADVSTSHSFALCSRPP